MRWLGAGLEGGGPTGFGLLVHNGAHEAGAEVGVLRGCWLAMGVCEATLEEGSWCQWSWCGPKERSTGRVDQT